MTNSGDNHLFGVASEKHRNDTISNFGSRCPGRRGGVKLFWWILLALTFVSQFHFSTAKNVMREERVCGTMDLGPDNEHMLYKLLLCDVIEGSLTIANVNFSNVDIRGTIPLREITGYLLIYRVYHLESLESIFPHLAIIRGQSLFGEYSLVIHENWDLQTIGLKSLVSIPRGSVRITKNTQLCYVNTVNWFSILVDMKAQHFVLRKNRNQNHCPLCHQGKNTVDHTQIHCWDYKTYQRICPSKCAQGSCHSSGECCDDQCLSGCLDKESRTCEVCRNFKGVNGECLEKCNSEDFRLANRRCVSKEKCVEMGLLPYAEVCSPECPWGWIKRGKKCHRCNVPCLNKKCLGTKIRTSKEASRFLNCTHIEGSLEIQLVEANTRIIPELEKYLSNIIEIDEYLLVRSSPQLTSLSFFKNLKKISGKKLAANRYALIVTDNYHLEDLWNKNQTVEIMKGKISFHFNPKLCYEKIENIVPSIKMPASRQLFVNDISPYSNGDKVVCGINLTNLTAEVEAVNATAVRIKVTPLIFEDKRIFLGYLYYFTETQEENLSIFDGRHGCGYDKWKSEVDLSKNVRHIVRNLKPFTKYGLFVKTFTVSNAHLQKEAFSSVIYFNTTSWRPGPISKFYANVQSDTSVSLHWWPPNHPNGPIKYYLMKIEKVWLNEPHRDGEYKNVTYLEGIIEPEYDNVEVEVYNRKLLDTRMNITLNCKCEDRDYWHGYTPVHHEYYDEAEVIFEDSVADFVFVPTDPSEVRAANKTNLTSREKQELFNKRMEDEERKALAEYDTGVDDFLIITPHVECHFGECLKEMNNNAETQAPPNTSVLPGNVHQYSPPNLEPSTKYRITIRACVEHDLNMCGPETALNVTTWNAIISPQ